jgi:hypothetical protein
MKMHIEVTDTFSGEANYSWVERYDCDVLENATRRTIVRRAKKLSGLSGVQCTVTYLDDEIRIEPKHACIVCFVTFGDDDNDDDDELPYDDEEGYSTYRYDDYPDTDIVA